MVTPNLYGNLVSNVVAGLCGGFGVVPGGNIGDGVAVFEQVRVRVPARVCEWVRGVQNGMLQRPGPPHLQCTLVIHRRPDFRFRVRYQL